MTSENHIPKSALPPEVQASLAERIIPLDLLPPRELPENPIPIFVTADNELSGLAGKTKLGRAIVALNGLLLTGEWASNQQLRGYGDFGKQSSFTDRISDCKRQLSTVTGLADALQKSGISRDKRYRLHPDLVFTDKRTSGPDSREALLRYVRGEIPLLEDAHPEPLEFVDPVSRRAVFSSMVRKYGTEYWVREARTLRLKERGSKEAPKFSPDALHQRFTIIDRGLLAYLQPNHTGAVVIAITDAIIAYDEIYDTLLPLLHRLTGRYSYVDPDLQSDLFQEGAAWSIRYVMQFEVTRFPERCDIFYLKMQSNAWGHMHDFMESNTRIRKAMSTEQYKVMRSIVRAEDELVKELKRSVSTDEIAEYLSMDPFLVKLMHYKSTTKGYVVSLDGVNYNSAAGEQVFPIIPEANLEADFDLQFDQLVIQEEAQRAFASTSPLTTLEKIALSLQFELFVPTLRGATHTPRHKRERSDEPPFVYPYTAEEFYALINSQVGANELGHLDMGALAGIGKTTMGYAVRNALRKLNPQYRNNTELALILGFKPRTPDE